MRDAEAMAPSSSARRGVVIAAACSFAVGCVTLLGWWIGATALVAIADGLPRLMPNTAVALVLAGVSLWALGARECPAPLRRLGQACAAVVVALGLAVLAQYIFAWDLGIDRVLFTERVDFPSKFPGRPPPNTALCCVLIGLSLLSLRVKTRRACLFSEWSALLAAALALTALTGYVFGVGYFYGLPPLFPFTGMALHAAIALLALCAGLLMARPDCTAFATLTASRSGGNLLRRFLPYVVLVPLVSGRLFLFGADRGAYPIAASLSLASAITTLLLGAMLWVSAARMNLLDEARQRAEEARAFLATVAQASDDAVIGTSLDGTILSWNPAAERLYGYCVCEAIGKKLPLLCLPERAAEAKAVLARLRRGERVERFEAVSRTKGGKSIDIEVTVSSIVDASGRVTGVSTICRDIGRRKAMEAEVARAHEAERRIRSQLEAIGTASAAVSEALASLPRTESGVRSVLEVLTRHAKEIVGADYAALGIGEDSRRPFDAWVPSGVPAERIAQIGAPPRPVGVLGAVVREGRTIRLADLHAHPAYIGLPPHHHPLEAFLGVPLRFHGRSVGNLYLGKRPGGPPFTEDDERVAELLADRTCGVLETARLCRAEANERKRLEAVVEQLPEAAILVDATGRLITCNRVALQYASSAADDPDPWGNSVLFEHRTPAGRPVAWEDRPLTRALQRGQIVTGAEGLLWRDDAGFVPVLVNAAPVRSDDGELQGAVAVFQDISVLKEIERQRQEWIGVIAHDLRQPIQVIATASQLLGRAAGERPVADCRKQLDRITSSIERLRRMIDDLLDASRIEARQLTLDRSPVDLRAQLGEILEKSADVTAGHAVRLAVQGEVPAVLADPGRLEQIVTNLLSNAAKYGRPEGDIVVAVDAGPASAHVAVTNWGGGVPEASLPHLFKRFWRAPDAVPRSVRGVGLGLYITKGLVEAHGGSISVESSPGGATTFRFSLPFAPDTARAVGA
ncbi:PAS domain S-box protein [Sorangium atrum]|uniref:histidine kinase n=1 Tax=Sorangium atrum TaxID=2995308 RepID=A0ABT5C6V5_9BACT|nr:PAS domain S-box protein [Sorangium aterium]MDC0680916.1 PAS domain S-box protein [Sorangium aterium]